MQIQKVRVVGGAHELCSVSAVEECEDVFYNLGMQAKVNLVPKEGLVSGYSIHYAQERIEEFLRAVGLFVVKYSLRVPQCPASATEEKWSAASRNTSSRSCPYFPLSLQTVLTNETNKHYG